MGRPNSVSEDGTQVSKGSLAIGYRKLIAVLAVIGVVALVPLNSNQADVLVVVLYTFVAGNAIEHMTKGQVIEKTMDFARRLRSPSPSGSRDAEEGDSA
jgi:hypothetical protein